MKDKLKNTLEHEVELLGRSISVLAIAGLLVVGGASAALLDSFGTVSGEADVQQAVEVPDSQSFKFNPSTAGDMTISDSFNYHSNQDEPVPVSITTEVNDVEGENEVDAGYERATNVDGVSVDQIVYNQWNTSEEGYDVSVTAEEDQEAETGYSISFTGQDSSDYAIAWFDASNADISSSGYNSLTYDGEAATDEDDVADNPLYDEAWVVTDSGEFYFQNQGDSTGGFDLSKSFTSLQETTIKPTETEIAAIGIGQGSPQASPNYDVDTTIKDVRLTGGSTPSQKYLEARTDGLRLVPNTYEGQDLTIRYGTATVADLALNAKPGDYGFKTAVDLTE